MKRKTLLLLLVFILTFALVSGCHPATDRDVSNGNKTEQTSSSTRVNEALSTVTLPATNTAKANETPAEGRFSLVAALDLFEKTFPEAQLTTIQFDREANETRYKIEGYADGTEYEMTINADTGQVIDKKRDDHEDVKQTFDFSTLTSPEEAYQSALSAVGPGWFLEEWELDYEGETLYYEFEFNSSDGGQDFEVKVNALDGLTVLSDR